MDCILITQTYTHITTHLMPHSQDTYKKVDVISQEEFDAQRGIQTIAKVTEDDMLFDMDEHGPATSETTSGDRPSLLVPLKSDLSPTSDKTKSPLRFYPLTEKASEHPPKDKVSS